MNLRTIFETKVTYSDQMYFHPKTGRQVTKEKLPLDYTPPVLPDIQLRHEKPFLGAETVVIELPNCGKQLVPSGETTIRCILP